MSLFRTEISFSNSCSEIFEWNWIFLESIETVLAILILFLTYISLAGLSPTKITAIHRFSVNNIN